MESIILKCNNCKKLLTPPIWQCSQNHLICSSCGNTSKDRCPDCKNDYSMSVLRTTGIVANFVESPCPFKKNGCEVIVKWIDINKHERYCEFKDQACQETFCTWEGPKNKLADHFLNTHSTLLSSRDFAAYTQEPPLIAAHDTINLNIDLSLCGHKIVGVIALKRNFLLHTIRNPGFQHTFLIVQNLEPHKYPKAFNFKVQIKNSNNEIIYRHMVPVESGPDVKSIAKKLGLFDYHLTENPGNTIQLQIQEANPHEKQSYAMSYKFTGISPIKPVIKMSVDTAASLPTVNPELKKIFKKIQQSQKYECPFKSALNCQWKGPLNKIVSHVKYEFPYKVIENGTRTSINSCVVDVSGQPFVFLGEWKDCDYCVTVRTYDDVSAHTYSIVLNDGTVFKGPCVNITVPEDEVTLGHGLAVISREQIMATCYKLRITISSNKMAEHT